MCTTSWGVISLPLVYIYFFSVLSGKNIFALHFSRVKPQPTIGPMLALYHDFKLVTSVWCLSPNQHAQTQDATTEQLLYSQFTRLFPACA